MRAPTLASLLLLAACGGAATSTTPSTTSTVTVGPAVAAPKASNVRAGLPDTPEGRQLTWVFELLDARKGQAEPAEVQMHFAASFLAAVPPEKFLALGQQVAPGMAGAKVLRAEMKGPQLHVRTAASQRFDWTISVDQDGKIAGLFVKPAPLVDTMDEALAMVPKLAPKASLLIAELDGETCKPLHAVEENQELAIGSAFKLYVLLGLADQVQRGKLKWDQELAVRDDWKSLPSGKTQNDPAGTKLTVRELANRMISISDNTATDHLLYTVGRKNVEAALHTAHHAQPLLDTPFLSTREMFMFRLGLPDAETGTYVALKAAQRRAFLDTKLVKKVVPTDHAAEWTTARHIDQVEWFASPMDLCGAMAALQGRAAKVPAVLDVLAINPGVPIDKQVYPYVGFKGGSEPGVLSGTWLLERDDHKRFVVSLIANDPAGPMPDETKLFGVALSAIELLGKEAR